MPCQTSSPVLEEWLSLSCGKNCSGSLRKNCYWIVHSLLFWKDDKNYSGFACHLKINRLWTCLDLLALQNQTESTPCTKLWQNKFFFRTFMVGWAFLSLCVSLLAMMSEASGIFHLCIKLSKGRLLVALSYFSPLCWIRSLLWLPYGVLDRGGWLFLKSREYSINNAFWMPTGQPLLHEPWWMNQFLQWRNAGI